MRKKTMRSTISILLLLGVLMANLAPAQATQIGPMYIGISQLASTLSISSSGGASCNGRVAVLNGYKADLTVELKQDGATIKTWTSSGSGTVSAGGTYYVASGHSYYVTATAKVYNSSGTLVESPSKDSPSSSY